MAKSVNGCHHSLLTAGERLFVATIKDAIKDNDFEFLGRGERLDRLAEVLGVPWKVCDWIRFKLNLPLE